MNKEIPGAKRITLNAPGTFIFLIKSVVRIGGN